ncbi:MAG: type II secretion system protein [Patescibacteria group bacterium]
MSKNSLKDRITTRQAGFTMIELLVVATIMIVLTAVGMVSYRNAGITSRDAKRKTDLESVRQALTMYRADQGSYPVGSSFSSMLEDIRDYLSDTNIADPKDGVYEYSSAGTTFSVCATLESTAEEYCVTNL